MIESKSKEMKDKLACLIIDDPLLKPQYGCINFEKLLNEMKDHNFFTEIAFIPSNYKRSDPRTINLLRNNPDYYSICIHGCNHLGIEFGINDYEYLRMLAYTALWRMEQHRKITGLLYDPIMVFPQGRFSLMAIKALKDSGYFAVCNTTIWAIDEETTFEEKQESNMRIVSDFPIVLRRYPKDKDFFIKDFNKGFPIIIVEHHGVFKNSYKKITDLVDWINSFGNIKWTSLLDIVQYYYAKNIKDLGEKINLKPSKAFKLTLRTIIRRFLCEARDNYIETNTLFNKLYKMLRNR